MPSFLDPLLHFLNPDGITVLPEMELLLFALGILMFDFLLEKREKYLNAGLALLGVAASGFGLLMQAKRFNLAHGARPDVPALFGFQSVVVVDGYSIFFGALFLAATGLVVLLSVRYLEVEREQEGEFYALVVLCCAGMMLLAAGSDLIVLFLSLEVTMLCLYLLSGYLRGDPRSGEAGVKFAVLGAFGSGILLYGFSILYGLSASTNVWEIGNILDKRFQAIANRGLTDWLVVLAFVTVAAGLFFKVAAAPFHQWAADVYEGAPAPVAALVSVASTVAGFALLVRLFLWVFGGSQTMWQHLVAGVAIVSLTWGNIAALTQSNVKRMLGYASVAHAGYLLLGLVAFNETGLTGILYYLMAYVFATVGVFATVIVLQRQGHTGDEIGDFDGLYRRSPAAAVLLLIFLLSLAGIPPTAGFLGKYYILRSLIETRHTTLAVVAALYTAPALYYYLRIVVHAWMNKRGENPDPEMSNAQAVALGVAVFVTLAAGLYPEPFTRFVHYALKP